MFLWMFENYSEIEKEKIEFLSSKQNQKRTKTKNHPKKSMLMNDQFNFVRCDFYNDISLSPKQQIEHFRSLYFVLITNRVKNIHI